MNKFSVYRIILIILTLIIFFNNNIYASTFQKGDILIASSQTDEIRIYDSENLNFKSSFTHELFINNITGATYTDGPNGVAFNKRGNLVVAAYTHFVEFTGPNIEYARYVKQVAEANENIIFDKNGNLYSTTSTGGSDHLNQYNATNYKFQQTINLPDKAGQLTGITFDDSGRLFVASQSDNKIHVLQADSDFINFTYCHYIESKNDQRLEGIQFNLNGELLVAGGNIAIYNPNTGQLLNSFDIIPDTDYYPVPITIDNKGRIFTSDFEAGSGGIGADLIRFNADGTEALYINDPGLIGPFGIVIVGANIPGIHEYDCPDSDNDGVPDKWDICINTEPNSAVYSNGCRAQDLYSIANEFKTISHTYEILVDHYESLSTTHHRLVSEYEELSKTTIEMYTKKQIEEIVANILEWGDCNDDGKITLNEIIKKLLIISGAYLE